MATHLDETDTHEQAEFPVGIHNNGTPQRADTTEENIATLRSAPLAHLDVLGFGDETRIAEVQHAAADVLDGQERDVTRTRSRFEAQDTI